MLAEATRLFAARGIEGTTTREVAAAAGTTERTLFKHFGSKSGLIQVVIGEVAVATMVQTVFGRAQDPRPFSRDEFRAWHRAFLADRIANAEASPEGYRILFRELFRDDEFRLRFGSRWTAEVFQPLSAHLRRMQDAGEIASRQDPDALATAFFSLNLGYLVSRFVPAPEHAWATDRDLDAIVQLFEATCKA
jgi:AcrR family transcriptional regulator